MTLEDILKKNREYAKRKQQQAEAAAKERPARRPKNRKYLVVEPEAQPEPEEVKESQVEIKPDSED